MRHATDVDFVNAARTASRAIFAGGERVLVRPLVKILLSKRTIGPGERRTLAELIAGHFRRPRGNPRRLKRAERERRDTMIERVEAIKASRRIKHDDAIDLAAAELGLVPDQLREWARTRKHRG